LKSLAVDFDWKPEDLKSQHLFPASFGPCRVEFENCWCGFYGLKSHEGLLPAYISVARHTDPNVIVAGVVLLWGKVVEGSLGFRATNARVESLIALTVHQIPKLYRVAHYFGVPLHTDFNLGNSMLHLFLGRSAVINDLTNVRLPYLGIHCGGSE
jgi:hypothetical protein